MSKKLGEPSQLAFVVPSVDEAAELWWQRYGVGPWRIWNLHPEDFDDSELHGEAVPYSMRIGLSKWGPMDMELIEPLDDHSIYAESLRAHGGKAHFHHLRSQPTEYEEVLEEFGARNVSLIQFGDIYGGIFHYFDTTDEIGTIWEISRIPDVRPPHDTEIPSR